MDFEQLNARYNTEFTNRLSANKHIFYEIYEACGTNFERGCGSYLFDGRTYKYCDLMYPKQELLYNCAKTANTILEIGAYVGHSLLIMLLANPTAKITCIDINDKYTRPAVTVLNKYFNNAITFIHNDSLTALQTLDTKFDFFHIDGCHDDDYINKEFKTIMNLNNHSDNILRIVFDDQDCLKKLQAEITSTYKINKMSVPPCRWNNVFFEIDFKPN